MNEDDVLEQAENYYLEYCEANELEPREDCSSKIMQMALMRVYELCEGGYESEEAIAEYMEQEILEDVKFVEATNRK